MKPILATLIFACIIVWLFYLDRDKTARTSKALWIPVIWLGILGSRPVSAWFGDSPTGANEQLQGSPVDAAVWGVLLLAAIGVLIHRNTRTRTLLTANWPILVYFFYCLISVTWSYHPDIAFKRWYKSIGDLAIALLIATDRQPITALSRLISRVGFVLLPASVLFIRWYGDFGRAYTPDGLQMNTGVTTNKNSLGLLLFVVSLCTLWRVLTLWRAKGRRDRGRHLLAQSILLAFGVALLNMADSVTSIACFILGGMLILATGLRAIRGRPARVHALCLAIFLTGAIIELFGGQAEAVHALGRKSSLSGRTEIWAALIPAAPSPIVGAGFESFWISPSVRKFQSSMVGWWHPEDLNEAHNGYLEVYLELGWVGVGLIALILVSGYRRAIAAFRLNPSFGGLMLAYIIASAFYSLTEAGFRMMSPMWIFLLLAIVSSSGVSARVFGAEALKVRASRGGTTGRMAAHIQRGATLSRQSIPI